MPCASFSMLDGPGGTGCDVPVRGCWVSRDVIYPMKAGVVSRFLNIMYQNADGNIVVNS